MQSVLIKVSNALLCIYHEINSQLVFLNFKGGFDQSILLVMCLIFCMLRLHTLSAYWNN